VSNADATAYRDDAWAARLVDHVVVPVRWRESMVTLVSLGAAAFLEVGAGSMVAGVAKRTVPEISVVGVASPDDVATVRERLERA
jgi:[acyl-carrier-protein] S-malonyltransferase